MRIGVWGLTQSSVGVIAKSSLMALWPYGLRFFLLLLLITQRHYSHPGSTGSMQAAKVRKLLIDCIL